MLLALILATNLTLPAPVGERAPVGEAVPRGARLDELVRALGAISDEPARVRAIHDAVARALEYRVGDGASQAPAVVLARGTANCDGYARLFEALARATGLEAKIVTGLARDLQNQPRPHAWNVVRLGGQWRFVDVTFDDPTVEGDHPAPVLRDDYLLTTPEVALLDHLPSEARWLLGAPRLTRAQFLAQGPERATTRSRGLSLGHVREEGDALVVPLENRARLHLLLRLDGEPCGEVSNAETLELRCPLVAGQPRRLQLFTHSAPTGLFLSVTEWTP